MFAPDKFRTPTRKFLILPGLIPIDGYGAYRPIISCVSVKASWGELARVIRAQLNRIVDRIKSIINSVLHFILVLCNDIDTLKWGTDLHY
jgi:hypothetical protein